MNQPSRAKQPAEKQHMSWHWYVSPRLWVRKIMRIRDTPHSIALGTAIGVFVAFTPTVGIQMLIVLLLAWMFKPFFQFNRVAGLIAVYISNPVTTVPIYWFDYWVGSFFVEGHLTKGMLSEILEYHSFEEWWNSLCRLTVEIGFPLLLGSIIVGGICGLITYPMIKWLVEAVQQRRMKRRERILAEHEANSGN